MFYSGLIQNIGMAFLVITVLAVFTFLVISIVQEIKTAKGKERERKITEYFSIALVCLLAFFVVKWLQNDLTVVPNWLYLPR